jgi:hypothetical protein
MRRKVSTIMDEALFRRVKATAAAEGRPLSGLLEAALLRYLDEPGGLRPAGPSSVEASWGAFALPWELVQQLMEEDDEYSVD